jgi:hypothetical protein
VRPELKAALGFVERLTLHPDELTPADADEARAAGVSTRAAGGTRLLAVQHDRPPRRLARLGRAGLDLLISERRSCSRRLRPRLVLKRA